MYPGSKVATVQPYFIKIMPSLKFGITILLLLFLCSFLVIAVILGSPCGGQKPIIASNITNTSMMAKTEKADLKHSWSSKLPLNFSQFQPSKSEVEIINNSLTLATKEALLGSNVPEICLGDHNDTECITVYKYFFSALTSLSSSAKKRFLKYCWIRLQTMKMFDIGISIATVIPFRNFLRLQNLCSNVPKVQSISERKSDSDSFYQHILTLMVNFCKFSIPFGVFILILLSTSIGPKLDNKIEENRLEISSSSCQETFSRIISGDNEFTITSLQTQIIGSSHVKRNSNANGFRKGNVSMGPPCTSSNVTDRVSIRDCKDEDARNKIEIQKQYILALYKGDNTEVPLIQIQFVLVDIQLPFSSCLKVKDFSRFLSR